MIEGPRPTWLPTGRVSRRRVLLAGAVGAGSLLVRPGRASATLAERVHRDVRDLMAAGRLPGLSAAIVRGREVVWTDAWGLANIEDGRRVTPDTLFMLASVSKTVVATAVLQAIEDGLFELDTHINRLLPFVVRNPSTRRNPSRFASCSRTPRASETTGPC
jgi:CubicO group peptidase (beta-lactamase class C family)